jgi:hypothetical protein
LDRHRLLRRDTATVVLIWPLNMVGKLATKPPAAGVLAAAKGKS